MSTGPRHLLKDLPNADQVFYSDELSHDLILDFFMLFSRFEYALKRAGYLRGNEKRVWADWDRFAKELSRKSETQKRCECFKSCDFHGAVDYLSENPPKKQVMREGHVDWQLAGRDEGEGEICFVLRAVRTVRNNLFHGGKNLKGSIEEIARNKQLLQHSIAVLKMCVKLHDDVAGYLAQV